MAVALECQRIPDSGYFGILRIGPGGALYEGRGVWPGERSAWTLPGLSGQSEGSLALKPGKAFLPWMATTEARGEEIPPSAQAAAALLRELGVSHVVTLPDNTSAPLLEALADGSIEVLFATREGEAVSLASGLWLGGARPAVLLQNTGLLEAGDGLRGTAARMGAPLLLLVTCRGYAKARAAGIDPGVRPVDRDTLVRSDLDSVAPMTEATLRAWGIPYHVVSEASGLGPIRRGWTLAHEEERPVAVLLDLSLS